MQQYSPAEPLTLATVLLLEKDPNQTQAVLGGLIDEPYQVLTAISIEAALTLLNQYHVDVVLASQAMVAAPQPDLFGQLRLHRPTIIRILLASDDESSLANRSVRNGLAHHFLRLPCDQGALVLTLYNSLVQRSFLPPESEGILPIQVPSVHPISSRIPPSGSA